MQFCSVLKASTGGDVMKTPDSEQLIELPPSNQPASMLTVCIDAER
jgi:hypothetical protein